MLEFVLRRIAVVLVMLFAFISPLAATSASAQADDLTCDDFTNQDAAQVVFELDDTLEDALEVDADGLACPDLPARDAAGAEDVELELGTELADFEEIAGDPDDDADAEDFAIGTAYAGFGDYDSVNVFWLNDTAAHIHVVLSDELDEADALDEALNFLPTTADVDDAAGEELDEGEIVFTGTADTLEELFTAAEYEEQEVGGDPGDIRVILIPGTADFAAIDIAIGLGEEFVSGGAGAEPTGDADEYLATVRESTDQMTEDLADFTELLANAETLSDADIDDLLAILNRWIALEAEAAALTAPEGLEEIQSTYEDAAAALADVSLNFSAFVADADDAALDQAFESLAEATALVAILDLLLDDEGV